MARYKFYIVLYCIVLHSIVSHMPIGEVWIYHFLFLFVCLFVFCAFVRLRISPARISLQLATSKFARWFSGVLGRESPIWGTLILQKPKIGRIGARRQVLPIDARSGFVLDLQDRTTSWSAIHRRCGKQDGLCDGIEYGHFNCPNKA